MLLIIHVTNFNQVILGEPCLRSLTRAEFLLEQFHFSSIMINWHSSRAHLTPLMISSMMTLFSHIPFVDPRYFVVFLQMVGTSGVSSPPVDLAIKPIKFNLFINKQILLILLLLRTLNYLTRIFKNFISPNGRRKTRSFIEDRWWASRHAKYQLNCRKTPQNLLANAWKTRT